MNPIKVLINGSRGRMGQALLRCGAEMPGLAMLPGVDLGDDLAAAVRTADVVIDFTHAEATRSVVEICAAEGRRLVIGTTGQDAATRNFVAETATRLPVVFAPNFSVGVNALFWLTRQAVRILGADYDLEVVEMHHRLKKDAPSGTARGLVEILAEERQLDYETQVVHGRVGMPGERPAAEIGVHALRGGDVVGDHTVIFAQTGERLELTHKASSRDTFARGALRAAHWLMAQPPGLYSMLDVLGLREAPGVPQTSAQPAA
jgi:4-hydroxy-tetrahydrodipicolinate reductase